MISNEKKIGRQTDAIALGYENASEQLCTISDSVWKKHVNELTEEPLCLTWLGILLSQQTWKVSLIKKSSQNQQFYRTALTLMSSDLSFALLWNRISKTFERVLCKMQAKCPFSQSHARRLNTPASSAFPGCLHVYMYAPKSCPLLLKRGSWTCFNKPIKRCFSTLREGYLCSHEYILWNNLFEVLHSLDDWTIAIAHSFFPVLYGHYLSV